MDAPPVRTLPHQAPARTLAWLIVPALITTVVTAIEASQPIPSYRAITTWWLISIACLILAALPLGPRPHFTTRPDLHTWAPWLGMIAIAAIPRLLLLDRFPTVLDGDEAAFMSRAVAFRQGELPDWFGISFYGNSNAWATAQSLVADLAGTGVAGHRTLSAIAGTIGVIATWRLGRHVVGEPAAAIGAILLAAWPLHLYFSRLALNNITDPTALTLALLFLVRTVTYRRPIDAVGCGLSLALGFYGFYGGRAFPFVILAILVVLAIHHRLGLRETTHLFTWIATSFITATMPLLVIFWKTPAEFGGHMDMVSPFTLTNLRTHPIETIRLYLPGLSDAIIYPFDGNGIGHFRYGPPYFGWPLCILIAIGVVALLIRLYATRGLTAMPFLAIPWFLLTAGIATTIPISGQRYLALVPVFALIAGFGLWQLATLLARVNPARLQIWPTPLALLTVGILTFTHLTWMASEDRQIETYADRRTIAAWDLGWRLLRNSVDPPPTIYFAGAPFVWSQSFPSLAFLTGGLPMIDLDAPLESPADVPALPPGTILILVPERASERCVIETAYPGVLVTEALTRENALLYYVFATEPPAFLSTESTPGETTTATASPATC
jgi:hypothetical protein